MTAKDIQDIYEYGYWANRKLFQALAPLSPEEFTRSLAGSYGSIRNTLVHVLSAEWGWLDRCGFGFGGPENYSLTVEELLRHAAVHSTHHRGQVALLCRVLGYAPGNFDLLFHCAERRAAV